ncbi:MAG: hypothetical protein EOM59_16210 [Clostridia bacterium]|nr:hypothetical protein [Clostridia bacterium]
MRADCCFGAIPCRAGIVHHRAIDRSQNLSSPQELPKNFIGRGEVHGFGFRQISKSPIGYIYEVTQGRLVHYEVFLRIINSRFNRVSYPSSKSFGVTAWTFRTLDEANRKYEQLINK